MKKQTEERPLCRKCQVPLLTVAEAKMGIHVSCVADIVYKQRQIKSIPRPRYGTRNTSYE